MVERKPARILHVDDDEANRYAVTRSLRRAGFEVFEAATGLDALKQLTLRPDLIILDVRLPDLSGFEVCRRIKADPGTAMIPVLHLSASLVSSADKAHGLDGGADAYLVRPVEPVEIVATVNALLRARRSEEAMRESEDRFRLAVEFGQLGTWDYRPNTQELLWSARTKEMFGLPADEKVDMTKFAKLLHSDDVQRVTTAIETALNPASAGEIDLEYRAVRADGSVHWIVAKGRTVFEDVDGQRVATRLIGMALDITDRKRYQIELENARAAAEEARAAAESANRVKDDFLATLSHELRTPLNAIIGWAQILESGEHQPGDLEEGLQTIKRNANIQAQLIEDLLDVSRIISGKLRLDVQPVDLTQVIAAALAVVVPAAETKKVILEQKLGDQVPPVLGDSSRLQQVVWNLLTNAVKFTPPGGRVTIQLSAIEDGVEIAVSDTGVGIAPEFLPHVFERFRQADASTRRRQGGLGLGLAIVRHLIELHGGSVTAQSAGLNAGSTFTVRLPCIDAATRGDAGPNAAHPITDSEGPLEGVRVLLVDDDDDSRMMLKRILESLRASVVPASTVAQAMTAIKGAQFDVVISDIGMPDEDGFDFIRQLRAVDGAAKGMPAIALTAFARTEDRQRALRSGYQEHVPKPVDRFGLAETIRRIVQEARKA